MKKSSPRRDHDSAAKTFTAERGAALLEYLYELFPDRPRKSVKSLLEHRQVEIDGIMTTQFNHPLAKGNVITILKQGRKTVPTLPRMELLFEDESFIIINKQAGLLSVAAGREHEETAHSILSRYVKSENRYADIFVVHRLDRETSGIMMFTKNNEYRIQLQENWEESVTKRIYYALAEGCVEKESGEIVSWLKENTVYKVYSSQKPGDGQKAVTHYRVIRKNADYSLLEVALETGRKNQIRVHLQDIGHSVAGDRKYGAETDPFRRLALHAGILEFIHPETGSIMRFESPVPDIFLRIFPTRKVRTI